MKKTLIALTLALLATLPAAAQLQFGFKGGVNMARMDTYMRYNGSRHDLDYNTTGFFVGPMLEYTSRSGFGCELALMYERRGQDEWKQDGLDMEFNLKYNIMALDFIRPYALIGFDMYANFDDWYFNYDRYYDYYNGSFGEYSSSGFRRVQCGFNLGFGIKLLGHLQVGATYQIPIGNISRYHHSYGEERNYDARQKVWKVSLGYLF